MTLYEYQMMFHLMTSLRLCNPFLQPRLQPLMTGKDLPVTDDSGSDDELGDEDPRGELVLPPGDVRRPGKSCHLHFFDETIASEMMVKDIKMVFHF